MNSGQLYKKLCETVRSSKCTSKGCLSGCQDNVQFFWFGKQYDQKMVTCSSCFIMNDEAVKKSMPTAFNVLPVSAFLNKFASEMKVYEDFKVSPKWNPTDLANRQKEHLAELDNFQAKLIGTLKALSVALQKFSQRAVEANSDIFSHQTFNQIIKMHSDDKMDDILKKMQILIKFLNIGEDGKYRFYDQEQKNKRLDKLMNKVTITTTKVWSAMDELLEQLQEKNESISKL